MKSIELAEVSALAPFIHDSTEPLILFENGQAIAAVIPTNNEDVEGLLLSLSPQFQRILERSQNRLETEGGLTSKQVRERLGIEG